MVQVLGDVFVNVVDKGADPANAASVNAAAIQDAIDTGGHVLFPAGTYRFAGVLLFDNEEQRCTFEPGAVLQPDNAASYVTIRGRYQVFTGLRIEVPHPTPAHSPVLDIDQAAFLVLRRLSVVVSAIATPAAGENPLPTVVRATNLVKAKLLGGRIAGPGTSGSVGLLFTDFISGAATSAPWESGAVGLRIERCGWAVRVECAMDEPSFIACRFIDNVDGAILLATHAAGEPEPMARGMRLLGCHASGGAPAQYIQVGAACTWAGGVVLGCTFGARGGVGSEAGASAASAASAVTVQPGGGAVRENGARSSKVIPAPGRGQVGSPGNSKVAASSTASRAALGVRPPASEPASPLLPGAVSSDPCLFRVDGSVLGVVVGGCSLAEARTVWNVAESGNVSSTGDMFNRWGATRVAGGPKANRLYQLRADDAGRLTVRTREVSLDAAALGFFSAAPAEPKAYAFNATGDRALRVGNERLVLAELLSDLAALGLVGR